MDTYQHTQNEARAEILENKKAAIDAEISDLRMYQADANAARWAELDAEIDALLLAKDNLTSGWIVDAESIAADDGDELGTHVIISGGEVLELGPQKIEHDWLGDYAEFGNQS